MSYSKLILVILCAVASMNICATGTPLDKKALHKEIVEEPTLTYQGYRVRFIASLYALIGRSLFFIYNHGAATVLARPSHKITVTASCLQEHLPVESAQMIQSIIKKAGLSADMPIVLSNGGSSHATPFSIHIGTERLSEFTVPEQELIIAHESIHLRDYHHVKRLTTLVSLPMLVPLLMHAYDKISFKTLQWIKQKCSKDGKLYSVFDMIQKYNHTLSSSPITQAIITVGLAIAYMRHQERQADIKAVTELGVDPGAGITYFEQDPNQTPGFFEKISDVLDEHPSSTERLQYFTALANAK